MNDFYDPTNSIHEIIWFIDNIIVVKVEMSIESLPQGIKGGGHERLCR